MLLFCFHAFETLRHAVHFRYPRADMPCHAAFFDSSRLSFHFPSRAISILLSDYFADLHYFIPFDSYALRSAFSAFRQVLLPH